MNGAKPAEPQPASSENSSTEQKSAAGPGFSSLLKGSKKNIFAEPDPTPSAPAAAPIPSPAPSPASTPAPQRSKLIPRWYFFAGDVALLLFSVIVVAKSPGPLGWKEVTFCIVAVVVGAILAVLGISQSQDE